MDNLTFLILHGYPGNKPDHWQNYLSAFLKDKSQTVLYPDLPTPDHPKKEEWLEAISEFFPLPDIDFKDQEQNYLMVYSDNDHYISEEEFKNLSEAFNIPTKKLVKAGHISSPDYGNWEWMNNECLMNYDTKTY